MSRAPETKKGRHADAGKSSACMAALPFTVCPAA
jgi:hypothetical protein